MNKKENEIALRLCDVNKKYKLSNHEYFQALYDVNVEFSKGELVSIVGESGSGKSTLMNLIGGLDSDFTGDIFAGEENLRELKDKQLDKYRKNHVGFVFQSFNLISHLSILDNVTLSLTLSNVGEKEKVERATKILERVGLSTQLKKKPTQLSGGQKQRVAIARALINDPEIIIADEPTGALDSQTSMQILEILKEIADSGKLVIMVTHSEKVASVSSRVVEISDGRIIGDRINKNYKRNKGSLLANLEETEQPEKKESDAAGSENRSVDEQLSVLSAKESAKIEKENNKRKKRNFKNFKEKQTLSMWSAIKLSFHNMWASKTKNILMSIGVAIGIGSLILMMCFSTGITDFITDTMKSYSDPTIVTISRKNEGKDGFSSSLDYLPFDEEHPTTVDSGILKDVNDYLRENKIKWKGEIYQIKQDDVTFGFNIITIQGAEVTYTNEKGEKETLPIYCVYSIPPYYTEKNIVEGERSQPPVLDERGEKIGGGGFMFTKKIYQLIENPVGANVEISLTISTGTKPETNEPIYTTLRQEDTICGIMDTSVMSGFLVLYVDYDYLEHVFVTKGGDGAEDLFAPTILYINTPDESITNAINTFLAGRDDYKGSIEDQFAGMFNNMTSVIGTSLIVISCISLLVSAMMILVVLYMSVTERTKEIGVLKSIGARRKDIRRIFTSESFLIGLLSGVVGILFNLLLTLIIWLVLTNLIGLAPISYRWWYFVVAVLVAIFISMVSGLYPANKASKLDPVESLRRE